VVVVVVVVVVAAAAVLVVVVVSAGKFITLVYKSDNRGSVDISSTVLIHFTQK
jgi:hypothetical protein